MWLLIAVVLVLICVCVAAASSEEEQQKATTEERQRQDAQAQVALKQLEEERRTRIAARRPEVLALTLKEEFPPFQAEFTYGRCQHLLTWFDDAGRSAMAKAKATEPQRADRLLGMLFAREVAPVFSAPFAAFAEADPENTWRTLMMCIETTKVRVEAGPATP